VTPVARIAEVPEGAMRAFEIDGVSVLLCRVEGGFYAVANCCTHAGAPLAKGVLRGFELTCPLHRGRFDVRSGRPLAAPAVSPIKTFPVLLEGGKVLVRVTAAKRPSLPGSGPLD
jgi:nitrite reductase/ring-hydroxylating ferredoxin subunit